MLEEAAPALRAAPAVAPGGRMAESERLAALLSRQITLDRQQIARPEGENQGLGERIGRLKARDEELARAARRRRRVLAHRWLG